jgi:hypothetical protein
MLLIADGYAALNHCFKFLASVDGMSRVHAHTKHLHKYTLRGMRELTHATGLRLCALYGANDAGQDSSRLQGSFVHIVLNDFKCVTWANTCRTRHRFQCKICKWLICSVFSRRSSSKFVEYRSPNRWTVCCLLRNWIGCDVCC